MLELNKSLGGLGELYKTAYQLIQKLPVVVPFVDYSLLQNGGRSLSEQKAFDYQEIT